MTELSGYALETLREGSEYILYRGRRSDDADPILVLTPLHAQETPANLRWLEHEYSLADKLDPEWAVRPLALTRHDGRTMLVREDPGGDLLEGMLGRPLELTRFLRLAISLTAALRQVHRQGLIHKHIRPASVLVDAAGNVRLTGFGMASRLPRERQPPAPLDVIAGTFAYMAPEQTGRMNRSIDARSDLYSLGVILYEMLTGVLPFTASDPIEWIHCHIARRPMPPRERVKGIPEPVAAIVMKLLAKTAEDRYQTAAGVEADLRACLKAWQAHGRIDTFPLGAHDTSDRLLIPEKLYGREPEIDGLIAAFNRVVKQGRTEFVLVSGYSGIGKSSVVNELHKALLPSRGLFAAGKFDQYKRNIPYATLAQAFQSLVRQLLSKNDAELGHWRRALLEALGPNGQLMVNLIPELALIIGEQPPVSELPPQDAHSRFQLVFRRFLGVFARPEHPLALFLDDLQWLDTATLELLERLVTEPDVGHLLLIGAYRDNEVSPSHPLMRALGAIRNTGGRVHEIVLGPLGQDDVVSFVADALRTKRESAQPLAELVFEKTEGNPFFAIQFIAALADEGLLAFDPDAPGWRWDMGRIRSKRVTDNVVDLMAGKLSRLPSTTLGALKQLACLGNSAPTAALSMILEMSEGAIDTLLWEVEHAGLVFRVDGGFAFLHDRVQEAVYALIPKMERAATHLRIGRVLAARTPPAELEEKIFEIVNQLDRGAALVDTIDEREQIAELNLRAGKRAKTSTAYASALIYLATGRRLLAEESWQRHYHLTFELEYHQAECEFLTGDLAAAEERLSMLSRRAANLVDLAAVTCRRIAVYTTLDRPDRAVEMGLEFLRHTGVTWSPHPTDKEVEQEFERIWHQLGSRPIEALLDLPQMSDPAWCATIEVLAEIIPPALFTDNNLHCLVIGRMANLSLEYGNSDGSCHSYGWVGMLLGPRFGDYPSGFRFGKLAVDLVEQRGLLRFKARAYLGFAYVIPWMRPLRDGLALVRRAFDAAQETGDLTFAAYSCGGSITHLLASGDPLGQVQREAENALEFVQKTRFGVIVATINGQLGLIRTLRGLTPAFGSLSDGAFDEGQFEQHLEDDPRLVYAGWRYWVRKLQARYYAGDYGAAVAAATKAQRLLSKSPSLLAYFEAAEYHFHGALARAAACGSAPSDERRPHFDALLAHHRQIALWAENCPESFADRATLVSAEIARLEGRELDAMRLYEEAVRLAREHGFIQNEGIANELAARFYAARDLTTIADAYLRNARSCYVRWGADGKVRHLDQAHPHLRQQPPSSQSDRTIGTPVEQLELATVVKVSQAVSGEIDLKKLIDTLMVIALEHAGGDRGLLIVPRGDELRIEAEATSVRDTVEVHLRQTRVAPTDLPESVLHYVIRTQDSLLLDATDESPFSGDEYIRQKRCRSVLCLPLTKQAKLIGVLYLENSLTSHAFTPARIAVLKLLASQAAISLENARLYSDLRHADAYLAEAQRLSHTGSFGWNVSSGEIFWSEETFRIFGFDRSVKPTLEHVTQRVHPEDAERVQHFIERAARDGGDYDREHRLLMPDGSVKHLLVVAHATKDDEGGLAFVGAVMDVTATKRAEEAMHQAQAELAHVTRVTTLGELAASIAHEVNQPLTGIVINGAASLRWLNHQPPALDETRSSVESMIKDAQRASEVIHRVRALSKKTEPEKAALDINDVIQEGVRLMQREVFGHATSLRLELASALPPVVGDRVQLQQVIINLAINAIQAMTSVPERQRELLIRSQAVESDQVSVEVVDAGTGIDPEHADRLFRAFFTTKAGGMGMGLSICRSIIEAHGGRMSAANNAGPGATFQFILPSGSAQR